MSLHPDVCMSICTSRCPLVHLYICHYVHMSVSMLIPILRLLLSFFHVSCSNTHSNWLGTLDYLACCSFQYRWCYVRQCLFLMFNCLDCLGDWCHVYSILCALQYTTAHLWVSLVFTTDVELYKNLTYIVYNYDTLL